RRAVHGLAFDCGDEPPIRVGTPDIADFFLPTLEHGLHQRTMERMGHGEPSRAPAVRAASFGCAFDPFEGSGEHDVRRSIDGCDIDVELVGEILYGRNIGSNSK